MFSPHLLAPKAALSLKCLLQHQPWDATYRLSLEETDYNTEICAAVNEQLNLIDRYVYLCKLMTGNSVWLLQALSEVICYKCEFSH